MKRFLVSLLLLTMAQSVFARTLIEYLQNAPTRVVSEVILAREMLVSSTPTSFLGISGKMTTVIKPQPISIIFNYHSILLQTDAIVVTALGLEINVELIYYNQKTDVFEVRTRVLGSRRIAKMVGINEAVVEKLKAMIGPKMREFFKNVRSISSIDSIAETKLFIDNFKLLFASSTAEYPTLSGYLNIHVVPEKTEDVTLPGIVISMIADQGFKGGVTFKLSGQNYFLTGVQISSLTHPAYPLNVWRKGAKEPEMQISSINVSEDKGLEIQGTNTYDRKIQTGLVIVEALAKIAKRDPSAGYSSDIPDIEIVQELIDGAVGDYVRNFLYSYHSTLVETGFSANLLERLDSQFAEEIVVSGKRKS